MKKRTIILAVAVVLSSMLLWGCGKSAQQPAENVQKEETKKFEGTVRIVVGFAPGGGIDNTVRGIQPYLQQALGVPIVIENKAGAQGVIAGEEFNNAEPDGHTLLAWAEPSAAIAQHTLKPKFNVLDFTPVFQIVGADWRVVTVASNSPYKTFQELMEASKNKSISAAVTGSIAGLQSIYLDKHGLKHKPVKFDSGSEGTVAVLGGHVDFCLDSTASSAKYVKDGRMRVLAVHAPDRVDIFADSPTFKELGYEGMEIPFHIGVYAPPGMSEDLIKMYDEAFTKAASDPNFVEWAKNAGVMIKPAPSAEWKKQGVEWNKRIEEILPALTAK